MKDAEGRTLEFSNANGTEPTLGWNLFTLDDILRMGGIRYEDIQSTGADVVMNMAGPGSSCPPRRRHTF